MKSVEVFSDIPLWTLGVWGVFTLWFSLFYYRRKSWLKDIQSWKRYVLIGLRFTGLFLLGLMLLGILIKGTEKRVDLPMLITIVDDSESMLNYADSNEVNIESKRFIQAAQEGLANQFNVLTFGLDDEIKDADNLDFTGNKTNLSNAFERIYNNYYGRNIGAIVLLSDGNYNAGTTPLLVAEKFKRVPIYTLSVGDTIQKVDHLVKSIVNNDIAFLNNRFPVEVSIEGHKTANLPFEIKLIKNGEVIQREKLQHQASDYSLIKTTFQLDANSLGIHEYTIEIDALSNEYNLENNEKSFFIEVLDDRSQVLLIAETLNPDAGAIRNALITENNLEVTTVTLDELPESFKAFDLLIWFDPGVKSTPSQLKRIQEAQKPKWYFITPQTSNATIDQLNLQAQIRASGRTDYVGAAFNQDFNLFTLTAETRSAIELFPPLASHFGSVEFSQNSSILAYQKVGNIAKSDPLIYFSENRNQKFAVMYGIGLWSWRIADYRMNQSFSGFNEIVRKTVQYLILRENTSRLRITMPSLANNDEEFMIRASFYNESYEPITEPIINFDLYNANDEHFEYAFLPLDESYQLNLGRLPEGRYTWEASTSFNGKEFEVNGSFAIRDLAIEKQSTKANHQLLQQMAENGRGAFTSLDNYPEIIEDLFNREDIVPITYETNAYNKLIDYLWLLLLIVAVFTVEWLIRRYEGAY